MMQKLRNYHQVNNTWQSETENQTLISDLPLSAPHVVRKHLRFLKDSFDKIMVISIFSKLLMHCTRSKISTLLEIVLFSNNFIPPSKINFWLCCNFRCFLNSHRLYLQQGMLPPSKLDTTRLNPIQQNPAQASCGPFYFSEMHSGLLTSTLASGRRFSHENVVNSSHCIVLQVSGCHTFPT